MAKIRFVFSNPRHHLEMMTPVARELARSGHDCAMISLAELRGFETPAGITRAIPLRVRKSPSSGAAGPGKMSAKRRAMQELVWAALAPRLRWLLRGADAVVVPNDAAYPYDHLARALRRRKLPFVLLQEGIRFPLPNEHAAGSAYGAGGARAICAWGEASAEHFRAVAPGATIVVTGNPRFDAIDPTAFDAPARALLAKLGLDETRRPLLYLSNPIDDQGFCSPAEKLALFEGFLRDAAPAVRDRGVLVKLHPREDVAAYRAIAAKTPNVHVIDDAPLFTVLAAGAAAVVLASTVGLEALVFGLPLGVLAIPGHGHVFDYVASGAAMPLALGPELARSIATLLATKGSPIVATYLERHLAHRGTASAAVAAAAAGGA
ncbi:MAG TPA: hypothetical protein VL463_31535 [Kofleriaceae bacterium]|nr:hypothetical protein [Kofleriaceae bacterium]